jgi:hypothetical protein
VITGSGHIPRPALQRTRRIQYGSLASRKSHGRTRRFIGDSRFLMVSLLRTSLAVLPALGPGFASSLAHFLVQTRPTDR